MAKRPLSKRQRRSQRRQRRAGQTPARVIRESVPEPVALIAEVDHAAAERLSWYAVQAEYRREAEAGRELKALGFDVYCPMGTRYVSHAGRREVKSQALIPPYLFVGLEKTAHGAAGRDEYPFDAVKQADGVAGILGVYGAPVKMPYGAPDPEFTRYERGQRGPSLTIRLLRDIEAAGLFDETRAGPKEGDTVRIKAGTMQGFAATFLSWEPRARIKLLIEVFGRSTEIVQKGQDVDWAGRAA